MSAVVFAVFEVFSLLFAYGVCSVAIISFVFKRLPEYLSHQQISVAASIGNQEGILRERGSQEERSQWGRGDEQRRETGEPRELQIRRPLSPIFAREQEGEFLRAGDGQGIRETPIAISRCERTPAIPRRGRFT